MAAVSKSDIAARAYQIWEMAGRPDGQDVDHWLRAEAEVSGILAPPIVIENPLARKPGARRTKRPPRDSKAANMGVPFAP